MTPSADRAAQSVGAREQKWYLLPGTNINVAGTIGKKREKMKTNNEKNKNNKNFTDFRVFFVSNPRDFHRLLCSQCSPK